MPIRDRIWGLVIKLARGKPGTFAKKAGIHNSVLENVRDGISLPIVENLIKICQYSGVSADYLLFGKEPTPVLEEFAPEAYVAMGPSGGDTEKLAEIVLGAYGFILETRIKISSERLQKWLTLLFEYWFTEKSKPDRIILKKYLDLTL